MTPSFLLNGSHYRVASYTRSAAALFSLQSLLGEELFLKAMQTFMNEWNGKHPTPYDFFFTFNRVAEEDLTWFWKPWYFEFHSPDLNLKDYKNTNGEKTVTIENSGGLPMPVKLKVYFADNTEKTIEISPRVWQKGEKQITVDLKTNKEILEIELGDELIPDINYSKREIINGD
jgi:aminopeptidase N